MHNGRETYDLILSVDLPDKLCNLDVSVCNLICFWKTGGGGTKKTTTNKKVTNDEDFPAM